VRGAWQTPGPSVLFQKIAVAPRVQLRVVGKARDRGMAVAMVRERNAANGPQMRSNAGDLLEQDTG